MFLYLGGLIEGLCFICLLSLVFLFFSICGFENLDLKGLVECFGPVHITLFK